ncbi:hypothetical protein ACQP00_38090 [Dactylosporangium sp. CS-047395]|uniref:hypothetical protein n=1 Tax=Dactylosporangium sp. CS-047395 TaxID=3239936 RepID=UPI003D8B87BA
MSDDPMRVLTALAVPDSGLRAESVLAAARASARRRRIGALAAAGLAGAVALTGTAVAVVRAEARPPMVAGPAIAAVPTVPPPACTVAPLARPGRDGRVSVAAIDPSGRFVVGRLDAAGGPWLVVWTDGAPTVPAGGRGFEPHDVNAAGVIAGTLDHQAAVFRGGEAVRLPVYEGTTAADALGINSRGDLVGAADRNGRRLAVLWMIDAPNPLGLNGDTLSRSAGRIADDGLIVGTVDNGGRAATWLPPARAALLPAPAGPGEGGAAVDVAGDWIAGWAGHTGPRKQAVRWNRRTGAVEALPGLAARAVSATGTVVGSSYGPTPGPALWRDGGLAVLTAPDGGTGGALVDISADGRTIVGYGGRTPAIWHC